MSRRQRGGLSHVSSTLGQDGLPRGIGGEQSVDTEDLQEKIERCRKMAQDLGRIEPADVEPSPEEQAAEEINRLRGLGVAWMDAEDAVRFEHSERIAITAVRNHLDERHEPTLVLAGALGVGKTIASAVWILRRLRGRQQKVWKGWIDATELLALSQMDRQGEWPSLTRAPLLAIQDLGEEESSRQGDWNGKLTALVYNRQRERLPTCITTNLAPAQVREIYGWRLYDRLRQHGQWVSVKDENLRHAATR